MCVMRVESLTFFTSVIGLQTLIKSGGRHTMCLLLAGNINAGSFIYEGMLMSCLRQL